MKRLELNNPEVKVKSITKLGDKCDAPTDTVKVEKQKKRGRKSSADGKTGYFYEEEEEAVKEYVLSDNQRQKNRIFNKTLYPAFSKMIESIIRRYGLFVPSEDFADTFNDTMSFLVTKLNKFDATKGFKAYSYCGTVCKRYLLLKRTNDMKKHDTTLSYDLIFGGKDPVIANDEKHRGSGVETDAETIMFNRELISRSIDKLQWMLTDERQLVNMSQNEELVGYALLELLLNWDEIFSLSQDKKFNKTAFLYFVREYTRLSTKEVRDAMKKYKDIYFTEKQVLMKE